MLKVIRRTAHAERNAARRIAKEKFVDSVHEKQERLQAIKDASARITAQRRAARQSWHDAWTRGPLAPRIDSASPLATLEPDRFRPSYPHRPKEVDQRCAWAGGKDLLCLAVGDRVVVMEGHEKGKIGPITSINRQTGNIEVEGVAIANVALPEPMLEKGQQAVQPLEASIPISAVRLVYPLPDPVTGTVRDVIIRELRPTRVQHDSPTRRTTFRRLVPGLNVTIPWPASAEPERRDHPGDTLRMEVEERTFVPTLLRPPMPAAVLDELRNRYSKFRTRHTPEFVAKKEAEAAATQARQLFVDTMRTPMEEFAERETARRAAREEPVLSEEMLEKIGRVIAKNQKMRLRGTREAATTTQTPP